MPHLETFLTLYGRQVSSSSGLTLTVSAPMSLSLIVDKDPSSFDHTISGRLTSDGSGVNGKAIRLLVNGTETSQAVTASGGQFSTVLNLQPLNDAPTVYNVQVLFDGDTPTTAAAKTTVNGTEYTICTTIQYGYKPASNATFLIVQPQSTTATQSTKTLEQMQAEAGQSTRLTTWNEFTWAYPWYRIHFVSLHSGLSEFDLGMSTLLFADTLEYSESLLQRISQLLPNVMWTIAVTIAGAEFTALVASSYAGPMGFVAALGISLGTKLGTLYTNWNSVDGLISAYIGSLFATVLGLVRIMSYRLVTDLIKLLLGIKSLAEFGFGKLYSIVSVPINIIYQGYILQRLHELGVLP